MRKISYFILFLICHTSFALTAQSLSEQYEKTVIKSNNYQDYKVVNQNELTKFWNNIQDSLEKEKQQLQQVQQRLNKSKNDYASLKQQLSKTETDLANSRNSVDSISLLGIMTMSKASYKILMWCFVIVLLGIAAFLAFRMTSFRKETRHRMKLFDEISEEYRHYKVNANEKEKKLARELQDERNRLEEFQAR